LDADPDHCLICLPFSFQLLISIFYFDNENLFLSVSELTLRL